MSKQELYAWSSFASTIAIMGFYIISVFGWPDALPDYSNHLTRLFINVFIITLLVEIILGIMKRKNSVEKDERDELIAAKGFKNAYLFLTGTLTIVLVQILLDDFLTPYVPDRTLFSATIQLFHVLLILLFTASLINRGTQIYFYRKMF